MGYEIKVGDQFKMPVRIGDRGAIIQDDGERIDHSKLDLMVACIAINNHDRMAEEIAELKGALFEIRSVSMRTPELKDDYTHEDVGILDDCINEAFGIAETALAKLNQEGEW